MSFFDEINDATDARNGNFLNFDGYALLTKSRFVSNLKSDIDSALAPTWPATKAMIQ